MFSKMQEEAPDADADASADASASGNAEEADAVPRLPTSTSEASRESVEINNGS